MSMRIAAAVLLLLALGVPATPKTPKEAAPIDLTGNWVSVVTEDWRWRMLIPKKGDYTSVPLSAEANRYRCRATNATAVFRQISKTAGGADLARKLGG